MSYSPEYLSVHKCNCKSNVKHRECLHDHPNPRLMTKSLKIIQIELEFGNVGFWGQGKTGVPGEKPLGARSRTNNNLNPHMTPGHGPGIEPGTHWLERSHHCAIPAHHKNDRVACTKVEPLRGSKIPFWRRGLTFFFTNKGYNSETTRCLQ